METSNNRLNINKNLLRAAAFCMIISILVMRLQGIFGLDSVRSYENEQGFLYEAPATLDAVYIGGSDVHAFWQPLFGWRDCGIATWNYSIDSIPIRAVLPLMQEARKRQPDALYIVSLSTFKKSGTKTTLENIHRIVDYMPLSRGKLELIDRLSDDMGYSLWDRVEFLFPIIRFHSRWSELGSWVFRSGGPQFKSSMFTEVFRERAEDISSEFTIFEKDAAVPEEVAEVIDELLDYCDQNQVKVLFVKVPQVTTQEQQGQMNALEKYVGERGYQCLDVMEETEALHIYPETDFYNDKHTNVHGSLKYCDYLAQYLQDHYDFADKRGMKEWKEWDDAAKKYEQRLSAYVLPFEFDHAERNDLPIPTLKKTSVEGEAITVRWEASEGADGYEIFRKCADGGEGEEENGIHDTAWQLLASVGEDTTKYEDLKLDPLTEYTYTVVPFQETEAGRVYGIFDIKGVTGKTEEVGS